ncbi:unnamed protein product, partial [marine sediment metagenome]
GLREGYYVKSDALIVMFDLTSLVTFKNASKLISSYVSFMGNDKPIVLCGTKCDIKTRKVTNTMIRDFSIKHNIPYVEISSKSNYHFEKPLVRLMKDLTGKEDLTLFVDEEKPVVIPTLPTDEGWCNLF